MLLMKTALFAFASLLLVSLAPAQDLPEGKGKDITEKTCTACHGMEAVTSMHVAKDAWTDVVNDMRSRGADGTNADFDNIIAYLAKYFGPEVNVNKAAAKELESLDITSDESAAIVKYRTDKGSIKDFADLSKVPGLDAKKLEPLKSRLKF